MDMGALDATVHGSIAQQYGVQGYPTIKYFAPGSSEPEDYNGGRTASDIVKFAEEKFAENLPAPEVVQITNAKVMLHFTLDHLVSKQMDALHSNFSHQILQGILYFYLFLFIFINNIKAIEAGCENHPLCVIAFLPHILDCQSDCRNSHIEDLQKLGDKYKKKDWGWLWTEGMAQPDLENAVEVGGFGYPAMVVLR